MDYQNQNTIEGRIKVGNVFSFEIIDWEKSSPMTEDEKLEVLAGHAEPPPEFYEEVVGERQFEITNISADGGTIETTAGTWNKEEFISLLQEVGVKFVKSIGSEGHIARTPKEFDIVGTSDGIAGQEVDDLSNQPNWPETLDESFCGALYEPGLPLQDQTIILKPEALGEEYQNPDYQVWFVQSESASGVTAVSLKDFAKTVWSKNAILGTADISKMPQWATNNLKELVSGTNPPGHIV